MKPVTLHIPVAESNHVIEALESSIGLLGASNTHIYYRRMEEYILRKLRDDTLTAAHKSRRADEYMMKLKVHPVLIDVLHAQLKQVQNVEITQGELLQYCLFDKPNPKELGQ